MLIQGMLLVLAGTTSTIPGPAAFAAGRPCVKIDVQEAGDKRARPDRFFSAANVKDIAFVVFFGPQSAEAAIDLAVHTPNGHLYQRLRVMPNAAGHGRREATVRLPVSGTLIVNSSLYGEWSVEPHLAGSPTSCARPEQFTIAP